MALPVRPLTWIGGQGTRAVSALVFIGIAVPPLGELLKPFVTEAIFLLLCISFMRVDIGALRDHLRRPGIVIAATAWTTLAVPAMIGTVFHAGGLDARSPDLFLALMLQAVASPMMAAPSLAALMGLDATLVLVTLVTSTALVPFTAPLFATIFFGGALSLSPSALGLKLAAILMGSLAVAAAIRWFAGASAIRRHKLPIDGLNILILLVGVTALIFRGVGRERALAIGLMVSQRNMGLMVAATDGLLPGTTWLYFALSQFPIYLSPQLLKPIVDRLRAQRLKSTAVETAEV